jgi:methyl-accepting chemotaxis protein
MGSAGTRFRNKLTAQKRLCDEHRAAVFEFMNLEYIDYDSLLEHSAVVFWTTQANNLDDHRSQVWQMTIPSSAGLGYYTKMNQFIVKTVSIMAFRGSKDTIEAGLLAYLGFMYMKEKAGNERAVGTLGFSNNMWPDVTSWQKFISLVAIQNNAYLYFEQFGSEEARKLHERLEDSKVARVVLRWQGFALANKTEYNSHRSELTMKNVDAADWFDNTTFRINQFRSVETLIATELNSFFDDVDNETEDFILGILLSISSLALLTIWVAIKGVRLILRTNAIGSYGNINKKKKRRKKKKKTSAEVADQ